MRILYRNLNILDIRCNARNNTKEQCSCISIVVPTKTEWLGKKRENSMMAIIGISIAYWRVKLR